MQVIVTSKDELSNIVKQAVQSAIGETVIQPKEAAKEKDTIYGINEAAEFLGIAKPTIYTRTSNGTIPHFKKGKRLYFRHSELVQWIEDGRCMTLEQEEQRQKEYLINKENR